MCKLAMSMFPKESVICFIRARGCMGHDYERAAAVVDMANKGIATARSAVCMMLDSFVFSESCASTVSKNSIAASRRYPKGIATSRAIVL
jgi:hypothetical protein